MTGGPRRPSRPSGWPPPAEIVVNATGQRIQLAPLAREVSHRYAREFPDEAERYGEHWLAWCVHDNQHILSWAVYEHDGVTTLERQLTWLAGLLEARGYPVLRLARDLDLAADVAEERIAAIGPELARRLRGGADLVRLRGTSR